MKKNILTFLVILAVSLFSVQSNAQDGYTYTLVHNGGYSFSVSAVPKASTSNFPTSLLAYGFTILLPDGATATINSSFAGGASASPFPGAALSPAIAGTQGYFMSETFSSGPMAMPAPSSGTITPMITFTVGGAPTSGELIILPNENPSSNSFGGALKSFLTADMTDDGMAAFPNNILVNPVAPESSVSGISDFQFSTLSTETVELENVSLFPNPATDVVNIKGLDNQLTSIEVFNVAGQKVLTTFNNFETLNVRSFEAGVYIVKLNTETGSKLIKLVKKK